MRNFKVGDRVWDIVRGEWGIITKIDKSLEYSLFVKFKRDGARYTIDGKLNKYDGNPRLFLKEIRINTPSLEECMRKLVKVDFNPNATNYAIYWDEEINSVECAEYKWTNIPNVQYFSGESIDIFLKEIEGSEISKEEFFDVYNEIFRLNINKHKDKGFNLLQFLEINLTPKEYMYRAEGGDENYYIFEVIDNNLNKLLSCETFGYSQIAGVPYFYSDNVTHVVDTLNKYKISIKQLNEAFKKLGWI